jgi:hypothetical protein
MVPGRLQAPCQWAFGSERRLRARRNAVDGYEEVTGDGKDVTNPQVGPLLFILVPASKNGTPVPIIE